MDLALQLQSNRNKCLTSSNRCHASRNKHAIRNASLLVTSALLVEASAIDPLDAVRGATAEVTVRAVRPFLNWPGHPLRVVRDVWNKQRRQSTEYRQARPFFETVDLEVWKITYRITSSKKGWLMGRSAMLRWKRTKMKIS